jgi:hypothetical protein
MIEMYKDTRICTQAMTTGRIVDLNLLLNTVFCFHVVVNYGVCLWIFDLGF